MLYFVSVYYSWTSEHPLYAFATKVEALEFMRHDYDSQLPTTKVAGLHKE